MKKRSEKGSLWGQESLTEKEFSGMTKMFYLLIWLAVTPVYVFEKTHSVVHIKSVHFTECRFERKLKAKAVLKVKDSLIEK